MVLGNYPTDVILDTRMTDTTAIIYVCDGAHAFLSCSQPSCPAKCHSVVSFIIKLAWSTTMWANHVRYLVHVSIITIIVYI